MASTLTPTQITAMRYAYENGLVTNLSIKGVRWPTLVALRDAGLVTVESEVVYPRNLDGTVGRCYRDASARLTDAGTAYCIENFGPR